MTVPIDGAFDVVGLPGPTSAFATLEPRRLAHGYLFAGPPGVGKKTFGRRLAQSLLCERPKATLLGYCDACPGCTMLRGGTHPDYLEHAGTIKIGEGGRGDDELTARELVRSLALRPYRGRARVTLLADVAFATSAAANALLKFFEEPPAGVLLILTTIAPGALIETIRSRLVDVPFGPLAAADVATVLVREGVTAAEAQRAARSAHGSLTRARAVLGGEDGASRAGALAWFARALHGEQGDASFLRLDDRGATPADRRALVGELIETLRTLVRDWAALRIDPGARLLMEDARPALEKLPPRAYADVVALLERLGETQRLSRTNVTPSLVLDYLRMQLAPGT